MQQSDIQQYIQDNSLNPNETSDLEEILSYASKSSDIPNLELKTDIAEPNLDSTLILHISYPDQTGITCNGTYALDLSDIAQSISDILASLSYSNQAINTLNAMVKEQQYKNGNPFSVTYHYGTTDQCTISDWSYQEIKIELSKYVIDSIVDMMGAGSGNLSAISLDLERTEYNSNVAEIISNFDTIPLHQKLGATLPNQSIGELLTANMLSPSDALDYIKQSTTKAGTQQIKTVHLFNELGSFAIIIDFLVDYTKHTIKTTIRDEKMLDLENKKCITDSALFTRIENRIHIPDSVLSTLFDDQP